MNRIALVFVHIHLLTVETFPCLRFRQRAGADRGFAVLRAQEVQPGRGTDGVLVELPLPCPLAGSPLEALAFQCLPLIGVGLFLKNELQAVLSLVDLGLASGECPTHKLGALLSSSMRWRTRRILALLLVSR